MSYVATVLRVMIASPGDVVDARDAVEKAIHGWNDAYAQSKQVILQPWRWETAAVPILGGHPQTLINSQGVDDSDIVFALFGGRLGSPTPEAISGTAEEIERAQRAATPVHLYFSTAPLPSDVDTEQLEALRSFKTQMRDKGLLGEFSNVSQLEHQVWIAIEHDILRMDLATAPTASRRGGVEFQVQPQQERELSGYSSSGKPRYSTNRWLEITNTGSVDAENVLFESVGEQTGMHLAGGDSPTLIHAGQTRRLPTFHTFSGEGAEILRITWSEDGEDKEREFHVG